MILEVDYTYLTASEVKKLRERIVRKKEWKHLRWGSFGPCGEDKMDEKPLSKLTTGHLEAILGTQPHIGHKYRFAILELLKIRYKKEKK